jgi:hypothetical protein
VARSFVGRMETHVSLSPGATLSPALSAMMCDGLGWFEETDYKRLLLCYDQVYYLLPEETVPFRDLTGVQRTIFFPLRLRESPEFVIYSFKPDVKLGELLLTASAADTAEPELIEVINTIPQSERLYTWRVVNTDGDLGRGESLGLVPQQEALAHAILLNKLLLAADAAQCIPVSGKPYIHRLLAIKFRRSLEILESKLPGALPMGLRETDVRHHAVVQHVVAAIVPDEELQQRSFEEILGFKAANRTTFERFSLTTRQLVDQVRSLPADRTFERDVRDLVSTELWREKTELEAHLRTAWWGVFASGTKEAIRSDLGKGVLGAGLGGIALGVLPALSLGSLTMAAVLGPAAAAASWAVTEALEQLAKRREARRHGLYYLMHLST